MDMGNEYEKLEREIVDHIEYNGFFLAYVLIDNLPESKKQKYLDMIQRKTEECDKGFFPLSSGI
ncbi:MAG: hypothetical protein KKH79_02895, partial [Candidatus Thermoplasmatota archaeon]|nr:hypothetical protein [Candidatus Thermoplasmatota archaeon]